MANDQHRGAFVVGSILGGAVGAVAALWTTPWSGAEIRRKLGFESEVAHGVAEAVKDAGTVIAGAGQAAKPLSGKALGLVEQAAAPLVGVKLGQTANNSQPGAQQPDPVAVYPVTDQSGIPVEVDVEVSTVETVTVR